MSNTQDIGTRYLLEVENAAMGIGSGKNQIRRFVCEDGRSWDGSWMTSHLEQAKVWKTEAGVKRWLAQRTAIKAKVLKATIIVNSRGLSTFMLAA